MDYLHDNDFDGKKRAGEQPSAEGSGVSQDGKAYKLIKMNYDIVIIVRTADPILGLSACFDKIHLSRSMTQHQCNWESLYLAGGNAAKRYP